MDFVCTLHVCRFFDCFQWERHLSLLALCMTALTTHIKYVAH